MDTAFSMLGGKSSRSLVLPEGSPCTCLQGLRPSCAGWELPHHLLALGWGWPMESLGKKEGREGYLPLLPPSHCCSLGNFLPFRTHPPPSSVLSHHSFRKTRPSQPGQLPKEE